MRVFKLFSARRRDQERAGQPDVYQYDTLPKPLRVQIIHIWVSSIGPYDVQDDTFVNRMWHQIHNAFAREKGQFRLGDDYDDPFVGCQHYLQQASTEDALDLIELSFHWVEEVIPQERTKHYQQGNGRRYADPPAQQPAEAIDELNYRMRDHGVGYQYLSGQMIRIDSQYVHAEAVRPALSLLQGTGFSGPSQEFLKAHEHYRHGRNKEAIAEALKAFESTMKTICAKRRWTLKGTETASQLLAVVFDHGLIPAYLTSHFAALRTTMEAGLPTTRNKTSGHGQGETPVDVPGYLAAYAIHLAATNIVLLVEAHGSLP